MVGVVCNWNTKSVNADLAHPQQAIPGNGMPFLRVADTEACADIVAYLATLKYVLHHCES